MARVEHEAEVGAQPAGDFLERLGWHVEHPSAHVALDVGVGMGVDRGIGLVAVVVVLTGEPRTVRGLGGSGSARW